MDRPPTPHRPRPLNSPRDRSRPHSDKNCNVNPLQHPSESSVIPGQNDTAISAVEPSSNTTAPTRTPPILQLLDDVKNYIKIASQVAQSKDSTSSKLAVTEDIGRFYQKWPSSGVRRFPPKVSPSSSSHPGSCEEPCSSAHPGQASSAEEHSSTVWAQVLGYLQISSELAQTDDFWSSKLAEIEDLERFCQKWTISGSGVRPLPPLVSPTSSAQPGSCEDPCTSAHAGQASSSEDKVEAAPGVSCIPTTLDSRDLKEYQSPAPKGNKRLRF